MLRSSWAIALSLCVGLIAGSARADLPPPDGTKFVGFELMIDNADASKDYAIVAYPCSNAFMPERAVAEITQAATKVGRRGGPCTLYAMARTDYADWIKSHDPKAPNNGDALDDLFKSGKVHACDGAKPSLTSTLPKTDARDTVRETLHVVKVDASSCTIGAASSSPLQSASASPSSSATPMPVASSSTTPPPAVTPGCGGCSLAPQQLEPAGIAGLALVLGLAWLRRGTRRT